MQRTVCLKREPPPLVHTRLSLSAYDAYHAMVHGAWILACSSCMCANALTLSSSTVAPGCSMCWTELCVSDADGCRGCDDTQVARLTRRKHTSLIGSATRDERHVRAPPAAVPPWVWRAKACPRCVGRHVSHTCPRRTSRAVLCGAGGRWSVERGRDVLDKRARPRAKEARARAMRGAGCAA